ncbi:hypothetical protein D1007_44301 [Hordeum vulgare]|nr:hypothetical protein D1007_44301 [Hordeum vulgare]
MHPTSSAKSPAMSSKDGLSCKAILRSNNGTMGLSSSSSSMVWHEGEVRKKEVSRTSKPKRTSFKCFQCNKTFPTQQAMAGHCSAHTRARSQKRAVARYRNQISDVPTFVASPPNQPQLPQHDNVNAIHFWCSRSHISSRKNLALPRAIRSLIMAPNRQQGANRGCQSVDGVDQGNMVGSQKDDLDLELHLFR